MPSPTAVSKYTTSHQISVQTQGAIELLARLVQEFCGRVRGREEDDGEGLDEKGVVEDLLGAVEIGGLLDMDEEGDCLFGYGDDAAGMLDVLEGAGGAVQDGTVDLDRWQGLHGGK